MNIDVSRRLTHTVTVAQVTGQSDAAEPTYGAPVTGVACFIERRYRRSLSQQGVEVVTDFDIMFRSSQTLTMGAKLSAGTRLDGSTVLVEARVAVLDDVEHPIDNTKVRIISAKDVAQI